VQSCDYFKQILELLSPYFKTPLVNSPATEDEVQALESHIGHKLPDDLRAIYLMHNGEFGDLDYHADDVLIPMLMCGYAFMSLEEIASDYDLWEKITRDKKEADKLFPGSGDEKFYSYPAGTIEPVCFNSGRIPFASDGGGNNLAIDLFPDKQGIVGQVINFGRDDYKLFQISKDFTGFLKFTLDRYKDRKLHYIFFLDEDGPSNDSNLIRFLIQKFGAVPR